MDFQTLHHMSTDLCDTEHFLFTEFIILAADPAARSAEEREPKKDKKGGPLKNLGGKPVTKDADKKDTDKKDTDKKDTDKKDAGKKDTDKKDADKKDKTGAEKKGAEKKGAEKKDAEKKKNEEQRKKKEAEEQKKEEDRRKREADKKAQEEAFKYANRLQFASTSTVKLRSMGFHGAV